LQSGVAVEKGTNTVISANFEVFPERKFNNLQTQFWARNASKEFFNSHAWFRQLSTPIPVSPSKPSVLE
jgi:hypothetical protein